MKWGRKNLLISWIYKLKRISINSESKPVKEKQKGKKEAVFDGGSVPKCSEGEKGRFFGGEDDGVWRLAFGEERVESKSEKAAVRSVLYEADDEAYLPPLSSGRRSGIKAKMVAETKALPEIKTCSRKLATLIKTPRITTEKNVRHSDKAESVKKQTEADSRKFAGNLLRMNAYDTGTRRVEDELPTERSNSYKKTAKEAKIEQIKSKSKQRMNSVYPRNKWQRRMTKQNSKVRVFSPRTAFRVETCKIRALEDMKKAKLKMKMSVEKEIEVKGGTELESFPVVKCSFDPRKDFRESMMEMILEKNIYQPEELEELLVCYLTLNSDEYHDLIVKVFRQVWIDLNETTDDTAHIPQTRPPYNSLQKSRTKWWS